MDEPENRLSERKVQQATGWKRAAFLMLAGFFFILGALGLAVPGLPGTPFFLLTSYLLVRSSPQLNERLLSSRIVGPMLVDWQVNGGVRTHVKVKAIGVVIAAVTLSLYFSLLPMWIEIGIVTLALIGIAVIWRLPEVKTGLKQKG